MLSINARKTLVCGLVVSMLGACASPSAIDIKSDSLPIPNEWRTQPNSLTPLSASDDSQWLSILIDQSLEQVIKQALTNNHQLQQSRIALLQTEQKIIANNASFWPSVDLSFSAGSRKSASSGVQSDSADLDLSGQYELDLWGKLSDYEQQLNLEYAAQKNTLTQQTTTLIKDVMLAWYQVIASRQQLGLSQQRLHNIEQNLAVIESGYESGLNDALDVYLSRNEVASEQANVANQQTNLASYIRQLESLVGTYPAGDMTIKEAKLPTVMANLPLGLPSDVVKNNPRLQSQWMTLMAQDAALAYSHKQRFPSIRFTASTGYASEELSNLVSNSLGWSLVGSITTPIFNAGRLKANEEVARLSVKSAEQSYLATLNSVFADIENTITKSKNLKTSLQSNQTAAESAQIAEQISFEQYLKGLVTYTTVLDAQSRAFNAQSNLINLSYQTLVSQLELYTHLGGNFVEVLPADTLSWGDNK